ncbi:Uncharacterized protein ABC855_g4847 [[Candida] zeylanoides]
MKCFSIICLLSALFSLAWAAPASSGVPLKPSEDPFYRPPQGFESASEGEVLRMRQTPHQLRSVYLKVNVKNSWQILVRSTDSHGNATAIVSTIIEPYNADPTRLVSYQMAEDAAYENCAPSYSIQYGASMDTIVAQLEMFFVQIALNKGWWIVMPDYEGHKSAFTAGRLAGHSVLDSIRGTLASANETGLDPDAKVGMWGYSGGTIATGWASALQPNYAPELKEHLVGAALGGFCTNISETIVATDNTLYAGLIPNGITGLSNEYPVLQGISNAHLNERYWVKMEVNKQSCLAISVAENIFATIFKGPKKENLWYPKGYELFQNEDVKDVLADVTLGLKEDELPDIPLFVYHGLDDAIVPSANTFRVYDIWKKQGINSMEVAISNTTRHITEFALGCPAAFAFLKRAFDGDVVNGTSLTYRSSNLDYPDVEDDIISLVFGIVRTLLGAKLGPSVAKRSGSLTDSPVLNARGFDDYDELFERFMMDAYSRGETNPFGLPEEVLR